MPNIQPANRYYPRVSSVVNTDDIPEILGFIKNGRISVFNNGSGHFKPSLEEALKLPDIIKDINIPVKRARYRIDKFIENGSGIIIDTERIKYIEIKNL